MLQNQHPRMLLHARMGIEKENLVKINTNINRWLTSKLSSILISTMNVQSLGNKHLQILDYFINCKIDISIITEIWINIECPMLISDLNSQSYGLYHLQEHGEGRYRGDVQQEYKKSNNEKAGI